MQGWPFQRAQIYNRRKDIHGRYGGQQQGGIITPKDHPIVICITSDSGEQHGYTDEWLDDGSYAYYGEGQVGDMKLNKGNLAIAEHIPTGEDLLLFQKVSRDGSLRFEGQFVCAGFRTVRAPDGENNLRDAFVFSLVPLDVDQELADKSADEELSGDLSFSKLRRLAINAGSTPSETTKNASRTVYRRSAIVRNYVIRRAKGKCELCELDAPFVDRNHRHYLEPHHIRRLSDGGPDDPRYMGALCPNCHREIHYGKDGEHLNKMLQKRIDVIEADQPYHDP